MIRNDFVRGYINKFRGKSKEQVYQGLVATGDLLSSAEKNIIYAYLVPQNLLDGELVPQIQGKRKLTEEGLKGTMQASDTDLPLLMNAYRTRQYGKYIRHLMHSFVRCNEDKLYILDSDERYECGICGKSIHGTQIQDSLGKEYLAYGSSQSDICLCPDCLMQLHLLDELIQMIEGKDYLTWGTVIKKN